jgi:sugar-phosphatase
MSPRTSKIEPGICTESARDDAERSSASIRLDPSQQRPNRSAPLFPTAKIRHHAAMHISPSAGTPVQIHLGGLLLDMDGVLISSTAADERGWMQWATLHGMAEDFSLRATHGRRSIDTIRALRPDLDAQHELERLEAFDAEDRSGILVLPGVTRLLAALPAGRWCVVTSASERLMRNRLSVAGLGIPGLYVSGDQVSQGKPNPEPYTQGAAKLGLQPRDCLVIEDAPAGISAGKAAGCRVLAVLTSHTAQELTGADWIIATLEDLTLSVDKNNSLLATFPPA